MGDGGRRSAARWRTLSTLLTAVERGVEAAARLDAARTDGPGRRLIIGPLHERSIDRQLRTLEGLIDHELDRLTVERLVVDLAKKKIREAA